MFRLVLLSCFLALAITETKVKPRILNGNVVDIRDYPYQLALQRHGNYICGASIISNKWALTAARCTDDSSASMLSVRAGSSNRESGGEVVKVKAIHQHPQYDSITGDFDISVLELDDNLHFKSGVNAVSLPSSTESIPVGEKATVSGWGYLREEGGSSPLLQAVDVTIVSNKACADVYGTGKITNRMMCAGDTYGGKDACNGDEGGPLVVNKQLYGIVSWGDGCARPYKPRVYTSVIKLRDFIKNISGI